MFFSWLIYPFPSTSTRCFCSCNSSFHFWTRSVFSRKYAIVSPSLLRLFCLGFTFSSLHTASFLCSAQAFLSSVFHFRCFCVVSFLIVFYGDLSCSFFFGCFFQSLYHLAQITFNSTCPLFVFHLCFKFLAQQCVSFSLTARLLTLNREA